MLNNCFYIYSIFIKKMNSHKEEQKNQYDDNLEKIKLNSGKKYIYQHIFDIDYQILSPIIKDMQMVSQLINLIKGHLLSDLIFICGNNSYSIESRFYFNYRNIIDFYVKVEDFIETDYFTKIKYYIYKTGPICKNFYIVLSLFKETENTSKLEIQIILLKDKGIIQRILKVIYGEFDYNILCLTQAIKGQKQNSFFFNSAIIKNEFNILSQIMQNVKLIEYMINGAFKKIINDKIEEVNTSENNNNYNNDSNKDKFIHINEIYKVIFNKKKELKNWLTVNNITFKIQMLKVREDKLVIQFNALLNNKERNINEKNSINNNYFIIHMRKLTNNLVFILNKCVWDLQLPENIKLDIKKIMKRTLEKIEKLCQLTQNKI